MDDSDQQFGVQQTRINVLPDGRVARKDTARYLGCSPKTLAEWQTKGQGPKSRLVGGRRFYMLDDLRAFAGGTA